ncbi:MAG: hypothetical protein ABII89_03055 [Candidatus Omnitrophota bacterium]
MYSPKLSEELVKNLYKIAQAKKVSMAKLVNDIVADAIRDIRVEVRLACETAPETKEVYVIADDSLKQTEA